MRSHSWIHGVRRASRISKDEIPELEESLSLGVKRSGGVSEMRIELLHEDILKVLEL